MSTPKFLSIPTAYKANKIYSVVPDSGDGDLTFTRASIRTRRNSAGSIEQLATGIPALNYKAGESCPKWSFEPQRANLLPYSATQDFGLNSNSRGSAQTFNNILGYNYDFLTAVSIYKTITTTDLGYWTSSFYVKISQAPYFRIGIISDAGILRVFFRTGTLQFDTPETGAGWQNVNYEATKISGDLYRLEITGEAHTTPITYVRPSIYSEGNNIWIGGAQLEKGYGATSLIETSGSTLQRLYDKATLDNLQTNGFLGATEGCVLVEFDGDSVVTDVSTVAFRIGTTNGRFEILYALNSNFMRIYTQSSDGSTNTYELVQKKNKVVYNYNASGVDVWVNGVKVLNVAKAFSLTNELLTLSGQSRQFDLSTLAMYNTKQTDELCQQLTTL